MFAPYQGSADMIRHLSENPEYFDPETLDVMIRALDEAWERMPVHSRSAWPGVTPQGGHARR